MSITKENLKIFKRLFTGLKNVYGTYNPKTGRSAYQVKKPVTDNVFLAHLQGRTPYGLYLLNGNTTRAIVIDFDKENSLLPIGFVNSAKHYEISSYIERSKSKGYHVWIFFTENGVPAAKARLVAQHILDVIEAPETEIFPKQDSLNSDSPYGNFINAPMFGQLVKKGRTVFLNPATFKPYSPQWDFLESVEFVSEQKLDNIIEINELTNKTQIPAAVNKKYTSSRSYALPICAQKMLQDGVHQYQRVSCFRLAVHLKRLGIPQDIAVATLTAWSQKNRPEPPKQILTSREITEQTTYAFKNNYQGYGCLSEAVRPFCTQDCPVKNLKNKNTQRRTKNEVA